MKRLVSAVRLDLRLQLRYGFYYAAAFSALVWIGVLLWIPERFIDAAEPYVLFGDLAIVGFFFVAGAVFFEKGERTLFALLATPLRFGEYLASKLATLTALAVAVSLVVVVATHGLRFGWVLVVLGVVLCSLVMLLAGFVSATPFSSLSEWLIPSTAVIAVLNLPLIHYSGLWESPIFYLIPTQGSLLLFGAAFGQVSLEAWQLLYAVLYQVLWVAVLGILARRAFYRYVVAGEGGS